MAEALRQAHMRQFHLDLEDLEKKEWWALMKFLHSVKGSYPLEKETEELHLGINFVQEMQEQVVVNLEELQVLLIWWRLLSSEKKVKRVKVRLLKLLVAERLTKRAS